MPPPVPRTPADYPWVEVNVSCKLCARRGRYRLADRYSPDQTLDGLLADLAHGCPYWRSKPRQYEVRCGARFEDLDRLRPADIPGQAREVANGNAPRAKEPPVNRCPPPGQERDPRPWLVRVGLYRPGKAQR